MNSTKKSYKPLIYFMTFSLILQKGKKNKTKNTEVLEKLHDLPKVTQAGSQQAQIIKPKFALL